MSATLEVLFTPADFAGLKSRDLSRTCCVVFDVLRATSSMVTALGNGAEAILPVREIPEALRIREQFPDVLLAGERHGLKIDEKHTGSGAFDLGNSPREFTAKVVAGRKIVMTTTNGTRALRACDHAAKVLVGSFLNLTSTAESVQAAELREVLVVCSGTFEETAYEDALAAGAFCDHLWAKYEQGAVADSALMARALFLQVRSDLNKALSLSRNGRRLLSVPQLAEDVGYCARTDVSQVSAVMEAGGWIRRVS